MTRTIILDAAVAAAKAWSHEAVEPRHVLYAICRTYQKRPDLQALMPVARAALDPRGAAVVTPAPSPAAVDLLDKCTSEDAAVAAARERLTGGGAPTPAKPSRRSQRQRGPACRRRQVESLRDRVEPAIATRRPTCRRRTSIRSKWAA